MTDKYVCIDWNELCSGDEGYEIKDGQFVCCIL